MAKTNRNSHLHAELVARFGTHLSQSPSSLLQAPMATLCQERVSVVGLIFIKKNEQIHLIMLRRSAELTSHPNQIALPGGFLEESDLSLDQALQRELQEELLLSEQEAKSLKTCGYLPVQTSLAGRLVQPILGSLDMMPDPKRFNKAEVAQVYFIHADDLRPESVKHFQFNILGIWRDSSLYETPDCKIWGLTARILDTLY